MSKDNLGFVDSSDLVNQGSSKHFEEVPQKSSEIAWSVVVKKGRNKRNISDNDRSLLERKGP